MAGRGVVKPVSLSELAEVVRENERVVIRGSSSKRQFCEERSGTAVDLTSLRGILSLEPEDQVVEVGAGTLLSELQEELAEVGTCLPLPNAKSVGPLGAGFPGTVGGLVSLPLPHGLEAQCGSARDWVLGLSLVRSDGAVARCGSKAVKNVAGYDVQKLIIGARGTLGIVASVILRLYPLRALPPTEFEQLRDLSGSAVRIVRCLPDAFERLKSEVGDALYAYDPASCTLWTDPQKEVRIEPGRGWRIGPSGEGFNEAHSGNASELARRTRLALDPLGKFNPEPVEAK